MHRRPPQMYPLPGFPVEPRRRIIMPAHPTYDDWTDALYIIAAAAYAGEPCPILIEPLADDPPARRR